MRVLALCWEVFKTLVHALGCYWCWRELVGHHRLGPQLTDDGRHLPCDPYPQCRRR